MNKAAKRRNAAKMKQVAKPMRTTAPQPKLELNKALKPNNTEKLYSLELKLTLEAPVAVGRWKPGGSVSEVERYVPGTVIRGAIAGELLRQGGQAHTDQDPGGDFAKLFTDDDAAIFTHAYPTCSDLRCEVLPATAVSSKAEPGFKKPKKPDSSSNSEPRGVFDTLIDRFCTEQLGLVYDPVDSEFKRVEPFAGFYSQQAETYQSVSLETRLLTRLGINRRRSTAEDEILYSIEVLNEVQSGKDGDKTPNPTVLKAYIFLSDDKLRRELEQYLTQLKTLYLGGSRSRGLGKVSIEVTKPEISTNPVEKRCRDFNTALESRYSQWAEVFGLTATLDPKRTFFTLDLQAEAILRDGWRRTTVVSEAMLAEMLGFEERLDEIQLHGVYSSSDTRSGWNAAWGLMKDVELVTTRGSVFFFSVPKDSFEENWLPKLKQLEDLGLGDRTTEGFGQVLVCSHFHTIFRENAV